MAIEHRHRTVAKTKVFYGLPNFALKDCSVPVASDPDRPQALQRQHFGCELSCSDAKDRKCHSLSAANPIRP
jgi:hypothetical protein